jgi:hypothetical protein
MLWKLGMYSDDGFRCVQAVEKERVVSQNGGTYVADESERLGQFETDASDAAVSQAPSDLDTDDVPF